MITVKGSFAGGKGGELEGLGVCLVKGEDGKRLLSKLSPTVSWKH